MSSNQSSQQQQLENCRGPNTKDKTRIKVFVRCRPPLGEEVDNIKAPVCVSIDTQDHIIKVKKSAYHTKEFKFDRVFDMNESQDTVYRDVAEEALNDVFKGYHCTIFVYGQTGTGKTLTISSQEKGNEGIIPRAMQDIFQRVQNDTAHEYTITMSYVQIYMEMIHDLLNPENKSLQIREDPENGIYINGVHKQVITGTDDALRYYNSGDENRVTALTKMNATSSRSHACLILGIEKRSKITEKELEEGAGNKKLTKANLFLVDLAGSERLKKTDATGIRKMEANYINLSLTTLGIVINSLECGLSHIPFRDSKLTRLLQDSLSGNGKTRIIVTVGPSLSNAQETISSLQFGQRAMKVQTSAKINQSIDYKVLSAKLQLQLEEMENKYRDVQSDLEEVLNENERLEKTISLNRNEIKELNERLRLTSQSIEHEKEELLTLIENDLLIAEKNKSMVDELKKQIEQMEIQHEGELDEIDEEHKMQQESQERLIYSLQEQLEEKEKELSLIMSEKAILLEKLNQALSANHDISDENEELKNQLNKVTSENHSLLESLAVLKDTNEKITEQLKIKVIEPTELEEHVKLRDQSQQSDQFQNLMTELNNLRSTNIELEENEQKSLQENWRLKTDMEKLIGELNQLKEKNEELISEKDLITQEKATLSNEKQYLEIDFVAIKESLRSQSVELLDVRSVLQENQNRSAELERELAQLAKEREAIIEQLKKENERIVSQEKQLEDYSRLVREKETEVQKNQRRVDLLLGRLKTITETYCKEKTVSSEGYQFGRLVSSIFSRVDTDNILVLLLELLEDNGLKSKNRTHSVSNQWKNKIQNLVKHSESQIRGELPQCSDKSVNNFISSLMQKRRRVEDEISDSFHLEIPSQNTKPITAIEDIKEIIAEMTEDDSYATAYERLVINRETFKSIQINSSDTSETDSAFSYLDQVEKYLRHDQDLSVLSTNWLNIGWAILSLLVRKIEEARDSENILAELIPMTNDLANNLLWTSNHAHLMNEALYECALELSKHAESFTTFQQLIEQKYRRERAAKIIQRVYKNYKKRKHIAAAQNLVEENRQAMKKIEELSRSKEALVYRLEQSNVETGQMLIRQSYNELENLFNVLRSYFLFDIPMRGSPSSSATSTPTSRSGSPRSLSLGPSPLSSDEPRRHRYSVHSGQDAYGEMRSRFFVERVVNLDDFNFTPNRRNSTSGTSPTKVYTPPLLRSNSSGANSPQALRLLAKSPATRNRSATMLPQFSATDSTKRGVN